MAFDRSIVRLKEIELHDGVWEVEGKKARMSPAMKSRWKSMPGRAASSR